MIVCPLCEHAQGPADACELCGRPLQLPPGSRPQVARLEGLEPTRLEHAPAGGGERLPELEPTHFEAAPAGVTGDLGWIEQTVAVRVGAVAVEALEVERIDREPGPGREPAAPTCRYCGRTPGPSEVFCDGCGMRLDASRRA